jgi:hypothetical protein
VIKKVVVIIEAYHCSVTSKMLSSIVLSSLTLYAEEIIGDPQCGFQCNTSTNNYQNICRIYEYNNIFCICQILEKKWEHSEAVHNLFIDFIIFSLSLLSI